MLFSAIFFALFVCVFSNSSDKITIQLQNVNILESLGLTGKNDTHGAAYDGRLDTILALGTNVYTARLGVGNPPQPVDFLLNFVGDLISPGVGDLSFVLTPKALGQNGSGDAMVLFGQNANGTRTFNNSASKTFKSHPDIIFKTTIKPTSLNFSLTGFFGEDIIMFNNITERRNITVRERSFGQVVQIHESKMFEQLSISGMLSMGKQSAVMERIRPKKIQLVYGKTEAKLMIEASPLQTNEFCESSGAYSYYDLQKDFGNETGLGLDAFRFKIEGVALKAPDMEYDDKIAKTVLVDPNNMFIQAPKRIVAKLALMINAEKRKIGRHQLYMIDCNEQYGPFTFKAKYNDIKLEKENLKIELPGNLLPLGQCLWAIQELDDNFVDIVNAQWIFGRPFFQQKHCLVIDIVQNLIGFPKYLGKY